MQFNHIEREQYKHTLAPYHSKFDKESIKNTFL